MSFGSSILERISQFPVILLIKFYQFFLSPLFHFFGARCRYQPTCSVYAEEALRRYGLISGSFRAVKRLLRCHPLYPGGFDPP